MSDVQTPAYTLYRDHKVKTERFDPFGRTHKERRHHNRESRMLRALTDPSFQSCRHVERPEVYCDENVCPPGFPMWDCKFPNRNIKARGKRLIRIIDSLQIAQTSNLYG